MGERSYLVALASSLPVGFLTDPLRHSLPLVAPPTVPPCAQLTSSSSSKKQKILCIRSSAEHFHGVSYKEAPKEHALSQRLREITQGRNKSEEKVGMLTGPGPGLSHTCQQREMPSGSACWPLGAVAWAGKQDTPVWGGWQAGGSRGTCVNHWEATLNGVGTGVGWGQVSEASVPRLHKRIPGQTPEAAAEALVQPRPPAPSLTA